ncbi:hypothetical protein [Streptomyces chartreusis]|uniref:hypothetical protein n=1 Tax=Streptomyces chartreusis TaxID=1969 RepID=UPI0037B21635
MGRIIEDRFLLKHFLAAEGYDGVRPPKGFEPKAHAGRAPGAMVDVGRMVSDDPSALGIGATQPQVL